MPVEVREATYSAVVLRRVRGSKKWRAVAHHEAGHAVIGTILRCPPVTLVGLTPGSSDRDGFCTSKPTKSYLAGLGDPYFWSPRKLRAYAISLLAGDIAERLIYRSRKYGAGSDHGKVVDLALAVAADSPDPLVSKWVAECEILVEQNRAAIGQVAEALLASDRLSLTGREIRDLMAGA